MQKYDQRPKLVRRALLGAVLTAVVAAPGAAGEPTWHSGLEEGLAAAARSGRPLLVVTLWKDGV